MEDKVINLINQISELLTSQENIVKVKLIGIKTSIVISKNKIKQ